jgi:hypothetical protein
MKNSYFENGRFLFFFADNYNNDLIGGKLLMLGSVHPSWEKEYLQN